MATIKKITTEDVMTALRENASAESEGTDIVYYLHITEGGKIVSCCQDADETFSVSLDQSDYFGEHAAEYPDDWGACCAATEDDPDSDFRAICEYLAVQANAWIEDEEADDKVVITEDIIALAKKISNAQLCWALNDGRTLCEALGMGDEWDAADGDTLDAVVEKAVEIALKDSKPVYLSVDNGFSYIAVDEDDELQAAIDKVSWGQIVSFMDDDARERAHFDVAPCTDLEFLKYYLEIAPCDLVIG